MRNPFAWAFLVVLIGGAAIWWYHSRKPASETPPPPPAETQAAPANTPPPIQHPIEEAQASAETPAAAAPVPALGDSDSAIEGALKDLLGAEALADFYLMDMVKRIVATVDNLPREKVAPRLMPVKPVPGHFAAGGSGSSLAMAPANAARYTPYVKILSAIDTPKLIAAYVHFYPLFQQAYRDLGYPNGYFNDRLVAAIDDMLAAPEPNGPIELSQPGVFYQFADPALEARSAGQKIMLRMGRENETAAKAKLREVRAALTAGELKKP